LTDAVAAFYKKEQTMPVKRRSAQQPVRLSAPGWGEDEYVDVKPALSYLDEVDAGQEAFGLIELPDGMDREGLTKLDEADQEKILEEAGVGGMTQLCLLLRMVVDSTVRYEPTEEQAAAGQPGDLVPTTIEAWNADLGGETIRWLQKEIGKLGKDPAEGKDPATFPAGTVAGAVGQLPGPGEPGGKTGADGGVRDADDGVDQGAAGPAAGPVAPADDPGLGSAG